MKLQLISFKKLHIASLKVKTFVENFGTKEQVQKLVRVKPGRKGWREFLQIEFSSSNTKICQQFYIEDH